MHNDEFPQGLRAYLKDCRETCREIGGVAVRSGRWPFVFLFYFINFSVLNFSYILYKVTVFSLELSGGIRIT